MSCQPIIQGPTLYVTNANPFPLPSAPSPELSNQPPPHLDIVQQNTINLSHDAPKHSFLSQVSTKAHHLIQKMRENVKRLPHYCGQFFHKITRIGSIALPIIGAFLGHSLFCSLFAITSIGSLGMSCGAIFGGALNFSIELLLLHLQNPGFSLGQDKKKEETLTITVWVTLLITLFGLLTFFTAKLSPKTVRYL